jgi:hypothetical protein
MVDTTSISKDNAAARRRRVGNGFKPFLTYTLRKPTPYRGHATMPTKLAEENELVLIFNFSSWIQALGFVFHNSVEKPVDKPVDNLRKGAFATMLHQIA